MSAGDLATARSLVTPEGVDLGVRLATMGERALALFIDLAIIAGVLLALTLLSLAVYAGSRGSGEAVMAIWLLGFFILRNFYFTIMESGPRAATFGKRVMGLRVVAQSGAAMSADAAMARNAMRELELYLPLSALAMNGQTSQPWLVLAAFAWCGLFVLFPLFNADRLRAGDLIAGTWVVKTPKPSLLPDLAKEGGAQTEDFFTEAELNHYGAKELQVLENVLRRNEADALFAVAERIRAKLGRHRRAGEADAAFLGAYYAALRRHLEQKLVLGIRKRDKHDTGA